MEGNRARHGQLRRNVHGSRVFRFRCSRFYFTMHARLLRLGHQTFGLVDLEALIVLLAFICATDVTADRLYPTLLGQWMPANPPPIMLVGKRWGLPGPTVRSEVVAARYPLR